MLRIVLRCPVCDAIMDVQMAAEEIAMAVAMLGGDARRYHAKESPECAEHDDWIKGWNKTTEEL